MTTCVRNTTSGDRLTMILRYYAIMILLTGVVTGCLFMGCKKRQEQSSSIVDPCQTIIAHNSVEQTRSPTSIANSVLKAKAIAPNVLFTGPGLYQSSNSHLIVEVKRIAQDNVTYRLKYSSEGDPTGSRGEQGPTYPHSEKELLMCWDEQGQLWTYHPIAFVHYHYAGDSELTSVFVGSGSNVRDQMPSAFEDALPRDIEEVVNKIVAESPNGVLTIPLKQESLSEQVD
jgi:hypothetical protein